jgi:hypothetical protein
MKISFQPRTERSDSLTKTRKAAKYKTGESRTIRLRKNHFEKFCVLSRFSRFVCFLFFRGPRIFAGWIFLFIFPPVRG